MVPGITAALAMAASLGVSLTHRAHAQSLRLITGHGQHGDLPPTLDWQGLADPASTLIFYMAGRTAPQIAQRLMALGLAPETPVVLMEALSRPEERRWTGSLAALPQACAGQFTGPVLIGIGQAFAVASESVALAPAPRRRAATASNAAS